MSIVGKILVFFNLLVACVASGFAVIIYVNNVNWQKNYQDLQAKYEDLKSEAVTKIKQSEAKAQTRALIIGDPAELTAAIRQVNTDKVKDPKLKDALEAIQGKAEAGNLLSEDEVVQILSEQAQKKGLTTLLAEYVKTNSALEKESAEARKNRDQSTEKSQETLTQLNAVTAEMKRLQTEIKELRTEADKYRERIPQLLVSLNKSETAARESERKFQNQKTLNAQLQERLIALKREEKELQVRLNRLRRGLKEDPESVLDEGASVATPVLLEGEVLNWKDNLMAISLGSQVGVRKGMQFRVKNKSKDQPTFFGYLTIDRVTRDYAVGSVRYRMGLDRKPRPGEKLYVDNR